MEYWIDGYNFLKRSDFESKADLATRRRKLAEAVAALGVPARIVYDARDGGRTDPGSGRFPGIRIEFARKADDAIVLALHDVRRPDGITVVSDDREVAGKARNLGARTASTRAFADQLRRSAGDPAGGKPESPSAGEVEEYLRIFGSAPDELAAEGDRPFTLPEPPQ